MDTARTVLRTLTGAGFMLAGAGHFAGPERLVVLIPPYLPYPLLLVHVSGALEIAGGLGLLVPATRRAAALGLAVLLTTFLPANVHMAVNGVQIPGFEVPPWVLWARLPFLLVFYAWLAWCVRDPPGS